MATIYLAAGVVLPVIYVNIVETNNILAREWILLLTLFVLCSITGVNWLSLKKSEATEEPAPKAKPALFKSQGQRKITQPAAQPRTATAPRHQEPTAQKHRAIAGTIYPPGNKPEITTLMEDVKNFIKLESWLMAMQKANEIIHFYPDSPEADKIRSNINFLIQKVKENK
jgi:hypothetical protein